jgi:hypothetical protein
MNPLAAIPFLENRLIAALKWAVNVAPHSTRARIARRMGAGSVGQAATILARSGFFSAKRDAKRDSSSSELPAVSGVASTGPWTENPGVAGSTPALSTF